MFSRISRVATALTIFSSLCLCVLAAVHLHFLGASRLADLLNHSNVLLARHGCFFALGVWLWISTTKPLKVWERTSVAVSIIACIGEILLRGLEYLPFQFENKIWLITPASVWAIAVGCIYVFSRPREAKAIHDGMAKRLRIIGLMTYPLYLVHHVVGLAIMRHLVLNGINKWFTLVLGIVSMVTLSWVVCKFCEPTIRKVLAGIVVN
jgi:peptidoglycan/LPS O-acetylase OafA/YrhL